MVFCFDGIVIYYSYPSKVLSYVTPDAAELSESLSNKIISGLFFEHALKYLGSVTIVDFDHATATTTTTGLGNTRIGSGITIRHYYLVALVCFQKKGSS